MINIATYESLQEANAYAELLRKSGIECAVENESWEEEEEVFGYSDEGPFTLWIHEEDEEDAFMVLESADIRFEPEQAGRKHMLVGGVISGVGLLTSMGDFTGIHEPWTWIPYGMIVAGAIMFVKGSREEQEEMKS